LAAGPGAADRNGAKEATAANASAREIHRQRAYGPQPRAATKMARRVQCNKEEAIVAILNVAVKRVLLLAVLMVFIEGAARTADQSSQPESSHPTMTQVDAPSAVSSGAAIFAELLRHNAIRDAELMRYSVVRTYEVRSNTGKLYAREIVKVEYQAPGQKAFFPISEEGSGLVRNLVLKRLMESEAEVAAGKEHHDSSIAPANYSFEMLGEETVGPYDCFVVRAIPKRQDKYLFEGTIWIDVQDYAIVQIAGHPAKRISFWIERADFVRQYQKIGEFWFPSEDTTFVRVRLKGMKTLTIRHEKYTVNNSALGEWSIQSTPVATKRLGR
jgi:hypothetical protein